MKKVLSVLVVLFVSFQLNAQERIPIVSKWIDQRGNSNDASQTETARQSMLLHNAHNNKPLLHFDGIKLQSQFQLKRNKIPKLNSVVYCPVSASVDDTLRHTYTCDNKGNVLTDLCEILLNNNWVNCSKETSTYDNNGKMLSDLFENWINGSWLNEYRNTNTYDNNGNILTELHEDMSGIYRSTYTYDNMDNLLTFLFETGSAINTLGNVWRDTYTYATENYGHIIIDISEQWLNNKWVNDNLLLSTYDNNNKAVTKINKQWSFGVWVNEWKDTCIYDSRGFLSTVLAENWIIEWVYGGRETLTTDNYGDILIDFGENWSNGKWINNSRLTKTYDNNRNLLTSISELWADSVWERHYSFGYTYDNFGNSIHGETDQNPYTFWGMIPLEIFYNFRNNHLNFAVKSVDVQYSLITDINSVDVNVKSFSLSQNYPNPFNPTTTIKYSIANEGPVKLSVYNVLGSKISDLVNGYKPAGNYSVEFNAKDLSSGMYLYKLESGNYTAVKKLLLLK